jgi:hypothetical protein
MGTPRLHQHSSVRSCQGGDDDANAGPQGQWTSGPQLAGKNDGYPHQAQQHSGEPEPGEWLARHVPVCQGKTEERHGGAEQGS